MRLVDIIKGRPGLKKIVHWSITPSRNPRPRLWIRLFVNPFVHKRKKGSLIRWPSRIDVFPWNKFELGKLSTIESYAAISNGVGDLIIGDRVRIGIGSVVLGPVKMGSGSGLGHNVFVSGFSHGYSDATINSSLQPIVIRPTIIEEEAHIGANSVIVPGVVIGKRSQIGAGSVVTTDIPPFSIAVGNPAKVIKQYDFEIQAWVKIS